MGGRSALGSFDGARLKAARRAAGVTQVQLQDSSGVPQPNISQMEKGKRSPEPDVLARLAQVLRVRPQDLCRDIADPGLRDLRERAGLLQEQAASLAGRAMSRSTYAMIESGATERLPEPVATALGELFGVSAAAIRQAHRRDVERRRSRKQTEKEGGEPA